MAPSLVPEKADAYLNDIVRICEEHKERLIELLKESNTHAATIASHAEKAEIGAGTLNSILDGAKEHMSRIENMTLNASEIIKRGADYQLLSSAQTALSPLLDKIGKGYLNAWITAILLIVGIMIIGYLIFYCFRSWNERQFVYKFAVQQHEDKHRECLAKLYADDKPRVLEIKKGAGKEEKAIVRVNMRPS